MQLVLVAGFKASAGKVGPKVRIFAGRWRFSVEHQKDSVLMLRTESEELPNLVEDKLEFISTGNDYVLSVKTPGTEPFINVFAEYINGSDTPKST